MVMDQKIQQSSDIHFSQTGIQVYCNFSQNILEKEFATHSSILAWKIPWTEEPGGLQSMGSLRVGHDLATSLLVFTFMHWRRKWQPTPVFLLGESQGRGSLVGCHLWGCTESDMTEATQQQKVLQVFIEPFNFSFFSITGWGEQI